MIMVMTDSVDCGCIPVHKYNPIETINFIQILYIINFVNNELVYTYHGFTRRTDIICNVIKFLVPYHKLQLMGEYPILHR